MKEQLPEGPINIGLAGSPPSIILSLPCPVTEMTCTVYVCVCEWGGGGGHVCSHLSQLLN
jgi:hypothetical protein